MDSRAQAIFLMNLVQDVNVARPLIYMASRDLKLPILILVSGAFLKRDRTGSWRLEIDEIAEAVGAAVLIYETPADALRFMKGGKGIIIAASESDLAAHSHTHDVLRLAGPSFRTITLQHGLECVGFLQSHEHDLAHGRNVVFGGETICGWMEAGRLRSLRPSERSKLVVTGPTSVLQQAHARMPRHRTASGLVCENLHSARFKMVGDFKGDFLDIFAAFCTALAQNDEEVVLRPHPGGQYVLRNEVALASNVRLNNNPMYKVDLASFAYGISAPSSILIDMVLAGIPTAVWRDRNVLMDSSSYDGLAAVSDVQDWLDFSRDAQAEPKRFLDTQAEYLEKLGMPRDPADVARRFATLLHAAASDQIVATGTRAEAGERVLLVANSRLATLQISFERPLASLAAEKRVETLLIDEKELEKSVPDGEHASEQKRNWVRQRLASFDPTVIVLCRYSGAHVDLIMKWAGKHRVPTIMHIDDDLLGVPETHGASKFRYHNDPDRLATVRRLLSDTDLVYCSTSRLQERLIERGIRNTIRAGEINCPGVIIRRPSAKDVVVIGYTGMSEKVRELEMIVPALRRLMSRHPEVRLELMGKLPIPAALEAFSERILCRPPVAEYSEFLEALASYGWDIGLCPLEATPFNLMKSNNKWVEYTSVGTAVVASFGTVYDECCAGGCGALAADAEEWFAAMNDLVASPERRLRQVARAQEKLRAEYSPETLAEQVLTIFEEAKIAMSRRNAPVSAAA